MNNNADWYVNASFQHVGSRYTQPGDQEPGAGNFTAINFFGPPQVFKGATASETYSRPPARCG